MLGNFDRCYAATRQYEGGKVDHPKDPGGRTNYGVTQRTYNEWLKRRGERARDVYGITTDEVRIIYKDNYWDAVKADRLPHGIDMVCFDTAINSGPARAVRLLQASLNAKLPREKQVTVDGAIGNQTITACDSFGLEGLKAVVREFCNRRLAYLKALDTWPTFGKGWKARVGNSQAVALGMLDMRPVKPSTAFASLQTGGKAYDDDLPTTAVSTETAAQAAGVAATGSGVLEALQGATATFQGLSDVAMTFKYIFIALTIGLAIYSVYTAWRSRKNRQVLEAAKTVDRETATFELAEGARDVVPA